MGCGLKALGRAFEAFAMLPVTLRRLGHLQRLIPALRAEHRALHAYFLSHLTGQDVKERHSRWCDLIDAHDRVAELLET